MLSKGKSVFDGSRLDDKYVDQLDSMDGSELENDIQVLTTLLSSKVDAAGVSEAEITNRDYYEKLDENQDIQHIIAHNYLDFKTDSIIVEDFSHFIGNVALALKHYDKNIPDGDVMKMCKTLGNDPKIDDTLECLTIKLIANGD